MKKTKRTPRLTLHRETLQRLTQDEITAFYGGQAQGPTETCPHSGCFVCDPFPDIRL